MLARTVRLRLALAALLPVTVAVPVAALTACGSGSANASATTMPSTDPNAYPAGGTMTPTATAAPTTAGTLTGTGPATPIAPMAAAVVQPVLVNMGQTEAQGGQPDGVPFAGQFAAGQTLEQTIPIKGNGCYTILGASVGIQQLDIQLVVQPTPLMQPIVVAQSTTTGPNATLGGAATGCWRNPTPLAGQGKVILRATSGQGLAAAQVFSK
ncbi:MAG: hypothetical protein JWP97_3889 [Labilithrix sp.]|nr:hypothetical protein [Labilithrix sp.]